MTVTDEQTAIPDVQNWPDGIHLDVLAWLAGQPGSPRGQS